MLTNINMINDETTNGMNEGKNGNNLTKMGDKCISVFGITKKRTTKSQIKFREKAKKKRKNGRNQKRLCLEGLREEKACALRAYKMMP